MKIRFSHSTSKIKSLADGIASAILSGELKEGDNLPSINEMSRKYKVSRDTVFKAFNELKRRNIIESTPTKGYFVTGEVNHVLLLLDTYSAFKQNLYNQFISNLPANYKVDLLFHQYNEHLFETIVRESLGKYSMYVVMNFSNEQLSDCLKSIPSQRLLLLDFGIFDKGEISYVCQDFGESFYNCLISGYEKLSKYKKLVFIFPEELCHPLIAIEYFSRFCQEKGFECEIIRKQSDLKDIESGAVYLCILTEDMVNVIKKADLKRLKLGEDFGIIVYNETPVLEVIKNGISSISIDFGLMGAKAAEFVKTKYKIQEILPTQLIQRGSL